MTAEHGTVGKYTNDGCRCRSCTTANSEHSKAYNQRQRDLAKIALKMMALAKTVK
jgi:hypothetical protein